MAHASLLLPVRLLVRLHGMAMHDNTNGIGRISTQNIKSEYRDKCPSRMLECLGLALSTQGSPILD